MDKKEEIFQLDMNNAEESPQATYVDGDIAIIDNIKDLPCDHNSIRVNILLLVACIEGKLQVDIDSRKQILHPNEILFCRPNVMINNYMISPNFKGRILCLSTRAIKKRIYTDNEIWNKAFHLSENPVLHVNEEGMQLFNLYSELADVRLKQKNRPYRKEVMSSIVQSLIYELLAELGEFISSPGGDLTKQGDCLFKRFIELLSANEVKDRFVAWYAEQLYVTPKYLSTVCKQVSGKTAYEWIHEFIVTDIRHLLKYSNKSIKEISEYLNFPNTSFFGKYVKEHIGTSPKEYRKQLRDNK